MSTDYSQPRISRQEEAPFIGAAPKPGSKPFWPPGNPPSSARKPSRRHWHAISNDARRFRHAYVRPPQGRPNLAVFGPLFFVGLIRLKARCGQKSSCELAAQKVYGLSSWKLIVRA